MAGLLNQLKDAATATAAERAKNAKAPREGFFSVLDELIQDLPSGRSMSQQELRERLKANTQLKRDDMQWPLKQNEIDYVLEPELKRSPERLTREELLLGVRERRPAFEKGPGKYEYDYYPRGRAPTNLTSPYAQYRFDAKNTIDDSYFENITDSPDFGSHGTHFSPQNMSFSRGQAYEFDTKDFDVIEEIQNDRANHSRVRTFTGNEYDSPEGPPRGWQPRDLDDHKAEINTQLEAVEQQLAELTSKLNTFTTSEADQMAATFQALRTRQHDLLDTLDELNNSGVPDMPFKDPADYGAFEIKNSILNSIDKGRAGIGITPRSPVGLDESNQTYGKVYPGILRRIGKQYGGREGVGQAVVQGKPVVDLADLVPTAGGRDYFGSLKALFDPDMYHRGDYDLGVHADAFPESAKWIEMDQQLDALQDQFAHKFDAADLPQIQQARANFKHELQKYEETLPLRDQMTEIEIMQLDEIMEEAAGRYYEAAAAAERNARAKTGGMDIPRVDYTNEFLGRVKKYGFPLFSVLGAGFFSPQFEANREPTATIDR